MTLARKYAQGLYAATQTKGVRREAIAERFVELLQGRGQLKVLRAVLREYRKIAEAKARRSRAVVRVISEKDARAYHDEIGQVLASMGIDEKPERVVDESVVGGVRVESHGAMYDRTHRRMLLDLYRRIVTE